MGLGFWLCRWWVCVERSPESPTQAGCIELDIVELWKSFGADKSVAFAQ
jgi:hypothetical protein